VGAQLTKIFPPQKVHVIANGIDFSSVLQDAGAIADEFRTLHDLSPSAPLVVTVGELKPLKGQRDFVLAANEVLKHIPDCQFVIAGRDNTVDKRFRRELRRLVKVFGHTEKFIWLDWLDDLSPLLSAADLFVSPSHSESFGLAILDAMAAGTPVVATETDGARELIADENAFVPIKEPLAMADKIIWFLQNDSARLKLGHDLAMTARERFGLTTMVDETESLYQRLTLP
jgi:glycosyltransferase involved in cell wall biosynthesis